MNCVRKQDQSFRDFAVFVVMIIVLLCGAVLPALAQDAQEPSVAFTDLHDFNPGAGDAYNFNSTRLAQARDGNLYAESRSGGTSSLGAVASLSTTGTESTILSFTGTNGDLATGGMTLGTDGLLYGDAQGGGTMGNNGVTFKVTTTGAYTALHNFANAGDGNSPVNALVLGTDGNYYGLTNSQPETLYKMTPAGVLTTLHTFTTAEGYQGGQLFQGSDGNLYSGMNQGGANSEGTLFKVTTAGKVTVLHNFALGGSDGAQPAAGMVQAPNGTYFGATYAGGTNGVGVLYKLTSSGTYTVLHTFVSATDGANPNALMLATDGNMYGVATNGGANSCGTLFKVTQSGTFSLLYSFVNSTGCNPGSYLTQDTDGNLYGVTNAGGAHGNGSFFRANLGISAFLLLQQTSGTVGTKVSILGQGFSSLSVVKFNGVQATSVTLTGTTYISATIPAGASDGFVTVTTGATTLSSTFKFTVHNSWATGAAIPTPVFGAAAGAISGKIYVVSGDQTYQGAPVNNNQVYNPATNSWSTAATIPTPVFGAASAVVSGVLYVIGGYEGSSETPTNLVQIYNPKTNAWTTGAAMPTARGSDAAVVDGTSIYVIGGNGSTNRLTAVEKYAPSTNTWTDEASLLTGVSELSVGLEGSFIVAADGYTSSGDQGTTEEYDVSTNAWSPSNSDPTARNISCYGVVSGLLYVAGGVNETPTTLTLNESFTASTKKWTTLLPMPKAAEWQASAVNSGQIYCFGGQASYQGAAIANVQIYQP